MSRGLVRFILRCCAVGGAFLPVPDGASAASSDQAYPVGELASTMGGATAAVIHDGASTWYNPAGLGRVTEEGISATLNVYGVQMERTSGFVGDRDLSGWSTAIFPGSLGYVKPLSASTSSTRHAIGIAVVVPDFARHELALDDRIHDDDNGYDYDLHVRERLLEQTLWLAPGWGTCFGPNLCLGAALHLGYWRSAGLYSFSEQYADADGPLGLSQVNQEEYAAVLVAGSLGAQWQMSNGLWLGTSLRLPARTAWGSGKLLVMDSQWDQADATADFVRRASDEHMKIDQRLPMNLRVGIGYETSNWLLAADFSLSLSQASYASVRAGDGTDSIQPTDASGSPVGDKIRVAADDARDAIFNVSLGAQYHLGSTWAMQAGFFTDFSGRPDSLLAQDEIHNHMNRYGITAGVAMKGTSSLTFVGIVAVTGSGKSFGIDWDQAGNMIPKSANATSTAIYLTLGGSTRLGDAPEPKAPPAAPPPRPDDIQPAPASATPAVAPEPPRE